MSNEDMPAIEKRVAFLRKEVDLEGFTLSDDVIRFVASSVEPHVDKLRGALIRLKAFGSMTGEPISVQDVREICRDQLV